jgi:hypothetical protein
VDITIQNDGTIQQLHERVLDATLYSHIRPNVVSKF